MSTFDPHFLNTLAATMGSAVTMVLLARKKGLRGFRTNRRRCPVCGRLVEPGATCPCTKP